MSGGESNNAGILSRGPSPALQAFGMTLAIWFVFVYGSYLVTELIAGRTGFVRDLPIDLPAVFLVALVAQALYPLAVRTAGRSPAHRWLTLFAGAIAAAAVQAVINILENRILGTIGGLDMAHIGAIRERFARSFLSHLYLSFANGALFVFLVEARRAAEQRVQLAETEGAAARARASALRAQLNPHFMFNALNSLSSLMLTGRNDDAEQMLQKLCDFMRLSLNFRPEEQVPLDDEFAAIESYLDVEAVRFGDRMAVELDCPRSLANAPVPGLILQPLVENAVKYGVARSVGEVVVSVAAARRDDQLVLTVSDTGTAVEGVPAAQGFGIGLGNVRERLADRYGDTARLDVSKSPGLFVATITLPFSER
jgi:hypothetical protein